MAQITETMVRDVVKEILAQMAQANGSNGAKPVAPVASSNGSAVELELREMGAAPESKTPIRGNFLVTEGKTGEPPYSNYTMVLPGIGGKGNDSNECREYPGCK